MSNANNVLLNLHTLLSSLPMAFREKVCRKCSFPLSTFYRKIKLKDTLKEGGTLYALSSEERKYIATAIAEVRDELIGELNRIVID